MHYARGSHFCLTNRADTSIRIFLITTKFILIFLIITKNLRKIFNFYIKMARFYTIHGSSRYYTIGYTHLCIMHRSQTISNITKQRAKEEKKNHTWKKMRVCLLFPNFKPTSNYRTWVGWSVSNRFWARSTSITCIYYRTDIWHSTLRLDVLLRRFRLHGSGLDPSLLGVSCLSSSLI